KNPRSTIRLTDNGKPDGKAISHPNSLLQDQRGRIWVSTVDGIGYFENDRYIRLGGVPRGSAVHAMAEDAEGHVWAAYQNEGLVQLSGDGTIRQTPWASLGRTDFATALAGDPAHRGLWVGFQNGGVVHFDDGRVRASYAAPDGLGEGRVNT